MRRVLRWLALTVAGGLVLAILYGVVGEFFIEWAREKGWYDSPSRRVDAFSAFVTQTWFLVLASSIVGVAVGLWIELFLRRHESAAAASIADQSLTTVEAPDTEPTTNIDGQIPPSETTLFNETADERAAKHDLAVFIAEHVLPTSRVQIDLHQAIIRTICGPNKVLRNLAWSAHKSGENMRQYIEHMKALENATREAAARVPLERVIELVDAVSKLHHALCSFPKWLAGPDFDYKSNDATKSLYEEWRARQDALVEAFKPFRRDPRLPRFYNLSGGRRLGEGFETDA